MFMFNTIITTYCMKHRLFFLFFLYLRYVHMCAITVITEAL